MRRLERIYWVSLGSGLAVLFFILFPILHTSLSTSPALLGRTLRDREVITAIFTSFFTATTTTFIATVWGVPFGYFLARQEFRGKRLVEAAVNIPVVIPHTVAGIVLLAVLSKNCWLGRMFSALGIEFVGTYAGIIIAMLFVSLPLLINAARDAFLAVPPRLENVARTLGATPTAVFFSVTLPLAWRGILTGMILTWARALSEFGAVIILAYHPLVAPTLIYERLESFGLTYAQPVAVVLILLALLLFLLLQLVAVKGEGHAKS
ncbi:molybdate/tungstate transport system permease protein [Thermodesulfitimonas autotrophica]|uniref:Molybdate/tungstate transport system permease protein n=1 Tax=Thermodesulfitimonas autotrophica TaxID=1894989 RepID=A0A3N5B1D1_9THEO|nr:ABC transporter permease [Thermodesulfitimonas autotrophica]RPF49430.1 molybdate/tungstate transport system permease protein [Thermodesulfitimonas autotrophica]